MVEVLIRAKFIDIKFLIGPAPEAQRQAIVAAISAASVKELKPTKMWTQVTKVQLKRDIEGMLDEEFSGCLEDLIGSLKTFVLKSVAPLDRAVREGIAVAQHNGDA